MTQHTYKGRLADGKAVEVRVANGRIEAVYPLSASEDLPHLTPPLLDLQHNGALGLSFTNLPPDPAEDLTRIANYLRAKGVGRIQATVVTADLEQTQRSLRALDACLSRDRNLARLFFGIFYEGNFISPDEGWRGCHNPLYIRDPDWDTWARLQEAAGGRIRMFNVDPSRPGALKTIRRAVAEGLRVGMGHCDPDPETIRAAADAGADLVTHFGNGMPPMIHRHRNPLWTWLADSRFKIGLIADGHHLPADLLQAVFRAKGREKAYLVSDAASASGNPPGDYGTFEIEPDGYCHVKGQEILAGAWHQLDRGVEKLCAMGWAPSDAWAQASVIPARILKVDLPRIEPGEPAEFVLWRYCPDNGLKILQAVSTTNSWPR